MYLEEEGEDVEYVQEIRLALEDVGVYYEADQALEERLKLWCCWCADRCWPVLCDLHR